MPRLHQGLVSELLARVVAGKHPVGERLPKETALAEEFGVSRNVAREAVRALEERNVAVVKHGRGATVQPWDAWRVLDPAVAGALRRGRAGRQFRRELAECRLAVEPPAAALAAERAGEEHVTALQAALEALQEHTVPAAEHRFHRALARATGNRALAATLAPVHDLAYDEAWTTRTRKATPDELAPVLAAVEAHDPEAARAALRAHLEAAAR